MKKLILALLLMAAPAVYAADPATADLTCTAPTQNTNGTPITDGKSFKFYAGTASRTYDPAKTVTITNTAAGFPVCAFEFTTLPAGKWYFAVTAVNAAGQESAYSGEVSKTIVSVPMPPTNLVVGQSLTAYTLVQSRDRVVLLPVGTMAPGTVCDSNQGVLGKFVVPRSAVTWAGSVRSEVVFAECVAG